jgi:hypothetical protein
LLIDSSASFATQSYLHGAPEGIEIGERHLRFLGCLVHAERRLDLEAVRADLLVLRDERAEFLSRDARTTIDGSLQRRGWTGSVPATRLHGDFAPWNLKLRSDGTLGAVDWEHSVPDDLPYLDLHQFRRQVMESLGRPCAVPWKAYTAQLRRRDSNLTDEAAATALTAAAIKYWLSAGWMDAWGEWSA